MLKQQMIKKNRIEELKWHKQSVEYFEKKKLEKKNVKTTNDNKRSKIEKIKCHKQSVE